MKKDKKEKIIELPYSNEVSLENSEEINIAPPNYFLSPYTLKLLILLIHNSSTQYKIKDIIPEKEWENVLYDFVKWDLIQCVEPFSKELPKEFLENYFFEDLDIKDYAISDYKNVADKTVLIDDDIEYILPSHTSDVYGQLDFYISEFISNNLISSFENYYSYNKLIAIVEDIFSNPNDFSNDIIVNENTICDFLSKAADLKLKHIRIYEFLLSLEQFNYIKIKNAFVVKEHLLNIRVEFLTDPKAISEMHAQTIYYRGLAVNKATRTASYNNTTVSFPRNADTQFNLLCKVVKNGGKKVKINNSKDGLLKAITRLNSKLKMTEDKSLLSIGFEDDSSAILQYKIRA